MAGDELDRKIREIATLVAEIGRSQMLTGEQLRQLRASQEKTDEQLRKTDEQLRKTDEQLRKTDEQLRLEMKNLSRQVGRLTGGWGEMVENLLRPGVARRLREMGFEIEESHANLKARDNGQVVGEIDLVLAGRFRSKPAVVVASIKSKVRPKDVDELVAYVRRFFKLRLSETFGPCSRLGAIAGVGFAPGALEYAEKHGLFAVRVSDDVAEVVNRPGFRPRVWPRPRR